MCPEYTFSNVLLCRVDPETIPRAGDCIKTYVARGWREILWAGSRVLMSDVDALLTRSISTTEKGRFYPMFWDIW